MEVRIIESQDSVQWRRCDHRCQWVFERWWIEYKDRGFFQELNWECFGSGWGEGKTDAPPYNLGAVIEIAEDLVCIGGGFFLFN